jgi:predicted nucleic acid-binding protein
VTTAVAVDTSCLVALAFGEPQAARVLTRLRRFDRMFASALIEAELMAAFRRERVDADIADFTKDLALVSPDRPLTAELRRTADAGYLRGADMWHVACALFLAPEPRELTFLTLDDDQRTVARRLGFGV